MEPRQIRPQNFAWFFDLHKRKAIDLEPPYQRRSVWNQEFKDFYVDTVLSHFPSPAIFLFEEISAEGNSTYSVVDGKQRLTTLFGFVNGEFPVGEKCIITSIRGKFFKDLEDQYKRRVWSYTFSVEYLSSSDEAVIDDVFDRINRNVARLTPQELRHAKYSGSFITKCEAFADQLFEEYYLEGIPSLKGASKKQMKDVQHVSELLLLVECGPQYYSQANLDDEFSKRDTEWEHETSVSTKFRNILDIIKEAIRAKQELKNSRLKNLVDFYSVVGALSSKEISSAQIGAFAEGLLTFFNGVDSASGESDDIFSKYKNAARVSTNIQANKIIRIDAIKEIY